MKRFKTVKKLLSVALAAGMLCQTNLARCEAHAESSKIKTTILEVLAGAGGIATACLTVAIIYKSNQTQKQQTQIAELAQSLTTLQNQLKELQKEGITPVKYRELQSQLAELQEELKKTSAELEQSKKQCSQQQTDLDKQQQKIDELNGKIQKQKELLNKILEQSRSVSKIADEVLRPTSSSN